MKVFLSGGSGFIAAHVLDILLEQGHEVITSVRSQAKADKIRAAHPNVPSSRLDFRIVEDIAVPGAFDEALKIDGLEAVIHTASPFHFNVTDTKKDLLDPAIIGTKGVLSAIKKHAPSVKKVVITSSFASIVDASLGNEAPSKTYTEKDWNPITEAQAFENPSSGYRASKTFAERAAWKFVEKEKPNFTLSTMCPPLVIGPVVHYLNSLDTINTSNERTRNFMTGEWKKEIPDTGTFIWVDVRDLALCHVLALTKEKAANERFFIVQGYFSNRDICEIIRKNFPELADKLPGKEVTGGDYPGGGPDALYKFDNSKVKDILGVKFRGLEESVADLVKSLKGIGA